MLWFSSGSYDVMMLWSYYLSDSDPFCPYCAVKTMLYGLAFHYYFSVVFSAYFSAFDDPYILTTEQEVTAEGIFDNQDKNPRMVIIDTHQHQFLLKGKPEIKCSLYVLNDISKNVEIVLSLKYQVSPK